MVKPENYQEVPTPCYIIDEKLLRHNLEIYFLENKAEADKLTEQVLINKRRQAVKYCWRRRHFPCIMSIR